MIYDGLRVLDRSSSLAGAYCAKLLADLVPTSWSSSPTAVTRAAADGLDGAFWEYLRTSQRSIARSAAGAWEPNADVLVHDRPGNTDALVAVTISPFGFGGPDDALNELGFTEEVLQARSGVLEAGRALGDASQILEVREEVGVIQKDAVDGTFEDHHLHFGRRSRAP